MRQQLFLQHSKTNPDIQIHFPVLKLASSQLTSGQKLMEGNNLFTRLNYGDSANIKRHYF